MSYKQAVSDAAGILVEAMTKEVERLKKAKKGGISTAVGVEIKKNLPLVMSEILAEVEASLATTALEVYKQEAPCPKCGGTTHTPLSRRFNRGTQYVRSKNRIQVECNNCHFQWDMLPLDHPAIPQNGEQAKSELRKVGEALNLLIANTELPEEVLRDIRALAESFPINLAALEEQLKTLEEVVA